MRKLIAPVIAILILSSCSQSYYQASSDRVRSTMKEVDKTDLAKVEGNRKDRIEEKRQDKYHSYAVDTDKKLNHTKNPDINKKKGWDGSFDFY